MPYSIYKKYYLCFACIFNTKVQGLNIKTGATWEELSQVAIECDRVVINIVEVYVGSVHLNIISNKAHSVIA